MNLISGTDISRAIKQELKDSVLEFKIKNHFTPGLSVILVGDDPASSVYVRTKQREAEKLGMNSNVLRLHTNVTEEELVNHIQQLNNDPDVHGILVQLPLPSHISEMKITESIDSFKDVDGLSSTNIGLLASGFPSFVPATPLGIQRMILRSGYEIQGKHVVILGRSNIVGRPLANLLTMKSSGANATETR